MTISRALVVDDSRLARIALSKMLKKRDIEVDMASSGAECLEYLASSRPDVIFMDFMMPDMNGYETTEQVLSNPSTADIPVVMCTSQDTAEDRTQARANGAKGFLTKPTTDDVLDQVLAEVGSIVTTSVAAPPVTQPVSPPVSHSVAPPPVMEERTAAPPPPREIPQPPPPPVAPPPPQFSAEQIKSVAKHAAEQVASHTAEAVTRKVAGEIVREALSAAFPELQNKVVATAVQAAREAASTAAAQAAQSAAERIATQVAKDTATAVANELLGNVSVDESQVREILSGVVPAQIQSALSSEAIVSLIKKQAHAEAERVADGVASKIARQTAETVSEAFAEKVLQDADQLVSHRLTELQEIIVAQETEQTQKQLDAESSKSWVKIFAAGVVVLGALIAYLVFTK